MAARASKRTKVDLAMVYADTTGSQFHELKMIASRDWGWMCSRYQAGEMRYATI